MNKINQKGFSHILILLLMIFIVVGGAGWYVWDKNKTNEPQKSSAEKTSPRIIKEGFKEYKNSEIGFAFSYPEDWALKEELDEGGQRGPGKEGSVTVTSPNGLDVVFSPNFGGKGGDCEDDPSDKPHNTKNCNTAENLSKENINSGSKTQLFLHRLKWTPSREPESNFAPDSEYTLVIGSDEYREKVREPYIGAVFPRGIISIPELPEYSFETYLDGRTGDSEDFFNQPDVKQAEDIFKSLKIIK